MPNEILMAGTPVWFDVNGTPCEGLYVEWVVKSEVIDHHHRVVTPEYGMVTFRDDGTLHKGIAPNRVERVALAIHPTGYRRAVSWRKENASASEIDPMGYPNAAAVCEEMEGVARRAIAAISGGQEHAALNTIEFRNRADVSYALTRFAESKGEFDSNGKALIDTILRAARATSEITKAGSPDALAAECEQLAMGNLFGDEFSDRAEKLLFRAAAALRSLGAKSAELVAKIEALKQENVDEMVTHRQIERAGGWNAALESVVALLDAHGAAK